MNNKTSDQESFRTFQLMSELENGDTISQRELANRLGVAVGLVNSYLKNLVAKGFVRVRAFPRNRYSYLLTPKGLAEKSRLAFHHFSYFTSLYTTTRQDYLSLFSSLQEQGVERVAFCGVDEVAEIAYLSLRETGLRLSLVMDEVGNGQGVLLGHAVVGLVDGLGRIDGEYIVLTTLKRGPELREKLLFLGVPPDLIAAVNEA